MPRIFSVNSPPLAALPFLSPLLASLSLSVEPLLSLSAGSPAVLAVVSGGPRGEVTQGELTPGLLLHARKKEHRMSGQSLCVVLAKC